MVKKESAARATTLAAQAGLVLSVPRVERALGPRFRASNSARVCAAAALQHMMNSAITDAASGIKASRITPRDVQRALTADEVFAHLMRTRGSVPVFVGAPLPSGASADVFSVTRRRVSTRRVAKLVHALASGSAVIKPESTDTAVSDKPLAQAAPLLANETRGAFPGTPEATCNTADKMEDEHADDAESDGDDDDDDAADSDAESVESNDGDDDDDADDSDAESVESNDGGDGDDAAESDAESVESDDDDSAAESVESDDHNSAAESVESDDDDENTESGPVDAADSDAEDDDADTSSEAEDAVHATDAASPAASAEAEDADADSDDPDDNEAADEAEDAEQMDAATDDES